MAGSSRASGGPCDGFGFFVGLGALQGLGRGRTAVVSSDFAMVLSGGCVCWSRTDCRKTRKARMAGMAMSHSGGAGRGDRWGSVSEMEPTGSTDGLDGMQRKRGLGGRGGFAPCAGTGTQGLLTNTPSLAVVLFSGGSSSSSR